MRYGYTRCDLRNLELSHSDRAMLPADVRVMADLNYRSTDPAKRFHWLKPGDRLCLPRLSVLAPDRETGVRMLLWLHQRGVEVWTSEVNGVLSGEMITAMGASV